MLRFKNKQNRDSRRTRRKIKNFKTVEKLKNNCDEAVVKQ